MSAKQTCVECYSKDLERLLAPDAPLEHLCSGAVWAEGPVWFSGQAQQEYVLFSDVKANRLLRYSRERGLEVKKRYSHYSNGNYRDRQGNLLSCEHGRRCISRTLPSGTEEILVDRLEGKRLNSPNDLVVKSDGSIWFTDPPYGIIGNEEGFRAESQIIGCHVYCYDERRGDLQIATLDVQRPNGLAFSPDEKYLYVADMSAVEFPLTGMRHLLRFRVEGNQLRDKQIFAQIQPGIPDGFRLDCEGNIFCSCEDGILIFAPEGAETNGKTDTTEQETAQKNASARPEAKLLGKIRVPERVSNCTFGGKNQDYLYITASTSLYGIQLRTKGTQYTHLL